MKRRLRDIATICSLAIAVGIAALWIRGTIARDQLDMPLGDRKCFVLSSPHAVCIGATSGWYVREMGPAPANPTTGLEQYPATKHWWVPQFLVGLRSPAGDFPYALVVPHWLPGLISIVLPVSWVRAKLSRRWRARAGQCIRCGYDLRATPHRCPECGAVGESQLAIAT